MATKVFVSPGVYTTETELSFVAQSVGVTTLGVVGETLKGPAFEPVFVSNYEEFQDYFGTTSPEKFVNTQIPKYELAYIAKAYLQQSNQLFVTRILGLSGYDAGPSWTITTIANVDCTTVENEPAGATPWGSATVTVNGPGDVTFDGAGVGFTELAAILGTQYTKFDGSVSTISGDMATAALQLSAGTLVDAQTALVWGPIDQTELTPIEAYSGLSNEYGVNDLSLTGIT